MLFKFVGICVLGLVINGVSINFFMVDLIKVFNVMMKVFVILDDCILVFVLLYGVMEGGNFYLVVI